MRRTEDNRPETTRPDERYQAASTGNTRIESTSTILSLSIQTGKPIAASLEAAWAVLADIESYPEWIPFVGDWRVG